MKLKPTSMNSAPAPYLSDDEKVKFLARALQAILDLNEAPVLRCKEETATIARYSLERCGFFVKQNPSIRNNPTGRENGQHPSPQLS